jgi:ATP-dependent Clp protease protease subunit
MSSERFKLKRRLIGILARRTGKSAEQIQTDSGRDYWMTAQQAKEYGLVDEVVKSRKDLTPEVLPVTADQYWRTERARSRGCIPV